MTWRRLRTASRLTIAFFLTAGLAACEVEREAPHSGGEIVETTDVVAPPDLRQSPMAIAAATLENGTYVKIVYSSPRKRGRKIFGGLVPYGEIWRTGANEATEITLTGTVTMAGHRVEAGTYALFTVPGENSWTIILNGTLGRWGAYDYDATTDELRFDVSSTVTEQTYEAFTISIDAESAAPAIRLVWENTAVNIPLVSAQ